MAKGRAADNKIIVVSNSLGGKLVDQESLGDGRALVYNEQTNQYIHVDLLHDSDITFEALMAKGDVGTGSDQLAIGNHDHEPGDLVVLFNNKII